MIVLCFSLDASYILSLSKDESVTFAVRLVRGARAKLHPELVEGFAERLVRVSPHRHLPYFQRDPSRNFAGDGPTVEISRHRLRQVYTTEKLHCQAWNLERRRGRWSASLSGWAACPRPTGFCRLGELRRWTARPLGSGCSLRRLPETVRPLVLLINPPVTLPLLSTFLSAGTPNGSRISRRRLAPRADAGKERQP